MGCDLFFGASTTESVSQRRRREKQAKAVCSDCAVIVECLADALKFNDDGVRGGLTRYERQQSVAPQIVTVGEWVLIARSAGFRGNCTLERRNPVTDLSPPTYRVLKVGEVVKQTTDETEAWIALHNADL
jgi:hypothetical protein